MINRNCFRLGRDLRLHTTSCALCILLWFMNKLCSCKPLHAVGNTMVSSPESISWRKTRDVPQLFDVCLNLLLDLVDLVDLVPEIAPSNFHHTDGIYPFFLPLRASPYTFPTSVNHPHSIWLQDGIHQVMSMPTYTRLLLNCWQTCRPSNSNLPASSRFTLGLDHPTRTRIFGWAN